MKKVVFTALLAVGCWLLGAGNASAINIKLKRDKAVVDGINYQLNAKKESATVVKNTEPYLGDIVIPEKITVDSITFFVEEIASGAFSNCPGLTSVSIPRTVTKIGSDIFKGCSSIAEITLSGTFCERK